MTTITVVSPSPLELLELLGALSSSGVVTTTGLSTTTTTADSESSVKVAEVSAGSAVDTDAVISVRAAVAISVRWAVDIQSILVADIWGAEDTDYTVSLHSIAYLNLLPSRSIVVLLRGVDFSFFLFCFILSSFFVFILFSLFLIFLVLILRQYYSLGCF